MKRNTNRRSQTPKTRTSGNEKFSEKREFGPRRVNKGMSDYTRKPKHGKDWQ